MATPKPTTGNTRSRPHALKPGARTKKSLSPIGWRDDPWVRRRIERVAMLKHWGYSFAGMEDTLQAWCFSQGQPSVGITQLRTDYQHYWDLMSEDVKIDAQQHEEALKLFKREGLRAWSNPNEGAMVRATGLNAAIEAEKQLMRLSGVVDKPDVLQQTLVIQTLNPELVGSDEYRRAVGNLLALLPGETGGSRQDRTVVADGVAVRIERDEVADPGPPETP